MPWPVPAGDADCDGFAAVREAFVATNPAKHCPSTSGLNDEPVDAWPTDFNDSQATTLADIIMMGPSFNKLTTDNGYNQRFNLNADNIPWAWRTSS